jgi:putative ATPase
LDSFLFPDSNQAKTKQTSPLADRMRPATLDELLGQGQILANGKFLRNAIEKGELASMVFWGPPGCGKTTLAFLLSSYTKIPFISFSAVTSGIQEIKRMLKELESRQGKLILFIDEIHRFNKLQQDAFLPFIENGSIILIGATTENPSFELNTALLSRLKVIIFKPLSKEAMEEIILKALHDPEKGLGKLEIKLADHSMDLIISYASGDARIALNLLEIASSSLPKGQQEIKEDFLREVIQRKIPRYDKSGEMHYDLISAVHKSLRGSDADAGLYYMLCMLDSGEDPLYIARRLVRFAAEDVGLADPFALVLAQSVFQSCSVIGYPECDCMLGELVVYLALAPKSNAVYKSIHEVRDTVAKHPYEDVPLVIRNAPTKMMKEVGYGEGYVYPPDTKEGIVQLDYLPDSLRGSKFYKPGNSGKEEYYQKRIQQLREKLGK